MIQSKLRPLQASLDFLPLRFPTYEKKATYMYPRSICQLKAKHDNLKRRWSNLSTEINTMGDILGSQAWASILQSVCQQTSQLLDLKTHNSHTIRSISQCFEVLDNAARENLFPVSLVTVKKKLESRWNKIQGPIGTNFTVITTAVNRSSSSLITDSSSTFSSPLSTDSEANPLLRTPSPNKTIESNLSPIDVSFVTDLETATRLEIKSINAQLIPNTLQTLPDTPKPVKYRPKLISVVIQKKSCISNSSNSDQEIFSNSDMESPTQDSVEFFNFASYKQTGPATPDSPTPRYTTRPLSCGTRLSRQPRKPTPTIIDGNIQETLHFKSKSRSCISTSGFYNSIPDKSQQPLPPLPRSPSTRDARYFPSYDGDFLPLESQLERREEYHMAAREYKQITKEEKARYDHSEQDEHLISYQQLKRTSYSPPVLDYSDLVETPFLVDKPIPKVQYSHHRKITPYRFNMNLPSSSPLPVDYYNNYYDEEDDDEDEDEDDDEGEDIPPILTEKPQFQQQQLKVFNKSYVGPGGEMLAPELPIRTSSLARAKYFPSRGYQ